MKAELNEKYVGTLICTYYLPIAPIVCLVVVEIKETGKFSPQTIRSFVTNVLCLTALFPTPNPLIILTLNQFQLELLFG